MANLFTDLFNRTAERLGASADWTERALSVWDVNGTQVVLTTDANDASTAYISSSYVTTADYRVTADMNRVTQTSDFGIIGRRVDNGVSDSDFYALIIANQTISLYSHIGGTWSLLDSGTGTVTASTFYTCYLEMEGTAIRGDFNNGEVTLSAVDANLTASGDAGFTGGQGGISSGVLFDNFYVDDLVVGGATGKSNPLNGPLGGPLAGMIG